MNRGTNTRTGKYEITASTTTTDTLPTARLFRGGSVRAWLPWVVCAGLGCLRDQTTPARQASIMRKRQEMMMETGLKMAVISSIKPVKNKEMKMAISKHYFHFGEKLIPEILNLSSKWDLLVTIREDHTFSGKCLYWYWSGWCGTEQGWHLFPYSRSQDSDASTQCVISNLLQMWLRFALVFADTVRTIFKNCLISFHWNFFLFVQKKYSWLNWLGLGQDHHGKPIRDERLMPFPYIGLCALKYSVWALSTPSRSFVTNVYIQFTVHHKHGRAQWTCSVSTEHWRAVNTFHIFSHLLIM